MITETLTWHPVASPPDSDTTVLIFDRTASEPVWLGYLDGDTWRNTEGYPMCPTHWAPTPEGPKA